MRGQDIPRVALRVFAGRTRQWLSAGTTKTSPSVALDPRSMRITFPDGQSSSYLYMWLRDHAKDPESWHDDTKQRLTAAADLRLDAKADAARVSPDGASVTVSWPDRRETTFTLDWLRFHSHAPRLSHSQRDHKAEKKLWDRRLADELPTVNFDRVVDADDASGLAPLLAAVQTYGLCFIDGTPATPEATERLARRIAFIRETHYGQFWDFTANMARGDTAYSNWHLPAHTDTTYFSDPIGLQLFHLLHHTDGTGGESLYVDGFRAAARLRETFPEHYRTLAETAVPTHAAGDHGVFHVPTPAYAPVLRHCPVSGDLVQIRYNHNDRSVLNHLSHERLEAFYAALVAWDRILRDTESELWLQNHPGRAVIVDNWRVLHGRAAFTGSRRLCGAYLGHDEYASRVRCVVDHESGKAYL